jgi:UDP-N-acetylglucosamine--N-acetylmuramyl-(pentapeptide) pyrophosphoryl-undecaprenol N-acetylglucosamine transferase
MIWITGGGTGGHLFPALHIAEELLLRHPDLSVHFIGAKRGQEARLWPERGLRHTLLPVVGNLRGGPWERLRFFSRLAWSLARCEGLYRRHRPRFVLGTGGYASFPAAQVAAWHGARLFWQEQNSFPGEVTRRLGAKCDRIFAGFPDLEAQLPGANVLFTGNPVRPDLALGDRWRGREAGGFAADDLVLLVLGGSGGAASINRAIARIADMLARKGQLRIWWQTGRREFEHWRTQIAPELFPGTICGFIDGMADAYAAADMVLARAGAMTTAEICAAGKPAVLVPFPHAAADHQTRNVELLVAAKAALRVDDSELEGEKLAEILLTLASDRTLQAKLAASARRLGRPRATAEIVDVLETHL